MGAKDSVFKVRFVAFFHYRPEDWKSLENEVAEPQNRPQNVKKCSPACPNHPPKTCETSPLPEPISTSSSTSSACLCRDEQCTKWGAGAVPPEEVFNKQIPNICPYFWQHISYQIFSLRSAHTQTQNPKSQLNLTWNKEQTQIVFFQNLENSQIAVPKPAQRQTQI